MNVWMRYLILTAVAIGLLNSTARGDEKTIEELEKQAKQALRRLVAEVKNDKKGLLDPEIEEQDRQTRVLAAEALERVIDDYKKELRETVTRPMQGINRHSREGLGLLLMAGMRIDDKDIAMLIDNLDVPNSTFATDDNPFHHHMYAEPLGGTQFISPLLQRYLTRPARVVPDSEIKIAAYLLKASFELKAEIPLAIIRNKKSGPLYERNPENIDRIEAELRK
jgi:hypothetical protein